MRTHGGIFIRSPRLMFNTDLEASGGGADNQEPKFPANTPVKDMTPEQQAAYWQDKARKHEDRVKAFGDITPEKLVELQQEAEELRRKTQTAEETALADATEAGRAEIRGQLAVERVTTALERATQGRIIDPAAAFALDKATFITGDKADTAAITAWVEANSVAAETPKVPFPNLFQGQHEPLTTSDRETGKAEAEKRFGPTP